MKTTTTTKQWMKCLLSMPLVIAGSVISAPTASADDVTATVFSAPGWDYANVRPGPSTDGQPIGKVQAGQTVQLECYRNGGEAKGPYGSSALWYKVKGYDSGWVADSMLSTGSDLPVTSECPTEQGAPPLASDHSQNGQDVDRQGRITKEKAMTTPQRHDVHFTAPFHTSDSKLATVSSGEALRSVPRELYFHYRKWSGTPGADAYISWHYFSTYSPFVEFSQRIPVGEQWYFPVEKEDIPTILALRKFDVYRVSDDCYVISDFYDFEEGSEYDSEYRAARSGDAAEFNVFSAGSLNDPYHASSDLCGIVPGGGVGGGGW